MDLIIFTFALRPVPFDWQKSQCGHCLYGQLTGEQWIRHTDLFIFSLSWIDRYCYYQEFGPNAVKSMLERVHMDMMWLKWVSLSGKGLSNKLHKLFFIDKHINLLKLCINLNLLFYPLFCNCMILYSSLLACCFKSRIE